MIFSHYQSLYGATEQDLGAVAVQLRRNARCDPNAVMQTPMTIDDYVHSRYIVRPLHLFDLCLVNDGAVCLIVSRADRARDLPHTPVAVAGWGEAKVGGNKLQALVRERLRPELQAAGRQALQMAGLELSDIGHLEAYDPATIHLINQLEGYGFVAAGEGLEFCKRGELAVGGAMPVNTNGGMLSGSYMHGWNLVAEVTRQLRHEAGQRQIAGLNASLFSLAQTDQVHPIVFTREAR
jgi:acetyl-CoA acetyltransferase